MNTSDIIKEIKLYSFFNKLKSLSFVDKIYLFGSRAKDEFIPGSDIDIALDCSNFLNTSLHQENWLVIRDILENADTLLKIDCIDFNSLSDDSDLKKNILTQAVLMFDRKSERLSLAFKRTDDALRSLEVAINEIPSENRLEIDATIQRFEFSFELFWLLLREIIRSKGITDATFPKDVLIAAYSNQLIENEKTWLLMLTDRNKTSHTYDKKLADEIYEKIKNYLPTMKKTFDFLFKKYN